MKKKTKEINNKNKISKKHKKKLGLNKIQIAMKINNNLRNYKSNMMN